MVPQQEMSAILAQYPDVNPKYWYTERDIFRIITALLDAEKLKLSSHGIVLNQDNSVYSVDGKTFSVVCSQVIGESDAGTTSKLQKLEAAIQNIVSLSADKTIHRLMFPLSKNGKKHWSLINLTFSIISQDGRNVIGKVFDLGENDTFPHSPPATGARTMLDPILSRYKAKVAFPYSMFGTSLSYPNYSNYTRFQWTKDSCGMHVVDLIVENILRKAKKSVTEAEDKFFSLAEELESRNRHLLALNDPEFNAQQKLNAGNVELAAKQGDSIDETMAFTALYAYLQKLPLRDQSEFYNAARAFLVSDLKLEAVSTDNYETKAKIKVQLRNMVGLEAAAIAESDDESYMNTIILKIWFRQRYDDLVAQNILEKFFKPELKEDQLQWRDATATTRGGKDFLVTVLDRYFMVVPKPPLVLPKPSSFTL